ncbi:sigma-54-dependent Fis family transcriptional regulator [Roseomonas stagni]|uniref:Sigma-54-dependent Fis family transcriptional regulator n=1 Tax=Falsiroseomonas algicola TaxID=2716930 RepID=A0A6M1LJP7_9PROT|nr:sigma-54 dependent transcriptional regulator [Falsiroseomonas algicola]NGM20104.1 sigma-54-dependent Fis family transcriptional regulator [Falsiroseomonas algicola]
MTTLPAGCSVVLVEDDAVLGQALMQRLRLARVTTHWARTATEGAALLRRHRPTLLLCDIRLPDGDGEALIARLMPELGGVPVVAMTAYGGVDQAVRLLRAGADDYLAKPFPMTRIFEKLAAFARRGIPLVPEETGVPVADAPGWRSPPLRALHAALERIGPASAPVLFLGESGAGKGAAARRLHALSGPRAAAPLAVVDCAALPADIASAEALLFGHGDAAGLLEAAGAGTLLLDEVADLSAPLQARLLGALEERRFRRIGGTEPIMLRARPIATTQADLAAAVAAGSFRADLLFRLSVISFTVPPLRDRPSDTEDLVHHFLRHFAAENRSLAPDALAAIRAHGWPGNVRELRNRVERAVLLGDATAIAAADLFPEGQAPATPDAASPPPSAESLSLAEARDAAEREHIRRVVARCGGRIGDAANALGIARTTLWERMRRLGLGARTDTEG